MFEQAFKNVDDVLWKEAGCTTELDYTEQTSWLLFLKYPGKEGSQLVTNCHQLKMQAADGKQCPTDVATAETLLHLVQSVPSPKAEPITLWLAKVGLRTYA